MRPKAKRSLPFHRVTGGPRRARYGAAPPTSRVATRSLRDGLSAALDPGASAAPCQARDTARPRGPAREARGARMQLTTPTNFRKETPQSHQAVADGKWQREE